MSVNLILRQEDDAIIWRGPLISGAIKLFSSVPVRKRDPSIWDLPVSILEYFGFERPEQMVGRSIFRV